MAYHLEQIGYKAGVKIPLQFKIYYFKMIEIIFNKILNSDLS